MLVEGVGSAAITQTCRVRQPIVRTTTQNFSDYAHRGNMYLFSNMSRYDVTSKRMERDLEEDRCADVSAFEEASMWRIQTDLGPFSTWTLDEY